MSTETVFALPIGAHETGRCLRLRIADRYLRILTPDPLPVFPNGYWGPLTPDYGEHVGHVHLLAPQQVSRVPLALVVDCQVQTVAQETFSVKSRFVPYYLRNILVLPRGEPNSAYRRITMIEAACVLAQHPRLACLRFWCPHFERKIGLVWFHGTQIVVGTATGVGPWDDNAQAGWAPWDNNSPDNSQVEYRN